MRPIRNTVNGILLLAMLGLSATAAAQQRLYGGAGIGVSKTAMSGSYLGITGANDSSLSRNDLGLGGKILAGYQVNSHLAVEGGYVASSSRAMCCTWRN